MSSVLSKSVTLVRDADGAACRDCEAYWDDFTNQAVPWSWRKSQRMHEGSGHKADLFAYLYEPAR